MSEAKSVSTSKYFSLAGATTTAQAFWIGTFAILVAIGAQIEIPHQPVPYTFQTFFVLLSGALLGKRNSFLSMMTYLAMGAIGLPVFSGGGFGFARLLGPTGGYLLSYPLAAFIIGYLVSLRAKNDEGKKETVLNYAWTFFSMLAGLLVVFSLGTLQLNVVYFHNWSAAFNAGFLIFSWWDLLKLASAVAIYHQLVRLK